MNHCAREQKNGLLNRSRVGHLEETTVNYSTPEEDEAERKNKKTETVI
jgi:hypothetical protein